MLQQTSVTGVILRHERSSGSGIMRRVTARMMMMQMMVLQVAMAMLLLLLVVMLVLRLVVRV